MKRNRLAALFSAILMTVSAMPAVPAIQVTAAGADTFSYPVQEFRFGIGDTNRSITISGTDSGDYVSSAEFLGNRSQKWYLNYISSGVYEIINSQTGYVLTNDGGLAVTSPDTDGAAQRWQIKAVSQDFEGNDLYYKIVSNADSNAALTFDTESNSFSVETYTGALYQTYKLNLDGLEGFAGNCMVNGKEKAGTIGGLLGETVFCDTVEEVVTALDSKDPKTVVVTANLNFVNQGKDKQQIRDDKTLVGSYAANTITDCQFRNDDLWGEEEDTPAGNIVIRNMNFVGEYLNDTGSGNLLLSFYGVRNLWLDHNSFSATFAQDYSHEVGKFVWINTPASGWADDKWNAYNPDYITASYNSFLNRYWTFAFGSQNTDTSRLHTTLMFNRWEQCSRRCPQYSNGYAHNYNNYHTVTGSSNPNASSQVIGGEGARVINENCRFEGYTWALDPDRTSCISFTDKGSYTADSPTSSASPISFTNHNSDTWQVGDCYGYHLVSAYNTSNTDIKSFCNTYSGAWNAYSKIHYITDEECERYVSSSTEAPHLKDIEVGDDPVYGKEGAVMDTTYTYTICNVKSGLYLQAENGTAAAGTDVQQNSGNAGWTLVDAGDGYYNILSEVGDGKTYLLNVSAGLTDNGTNIELWTEAGTDSQLFKFVQNDDGTYTIVTKSTKDRSAIGIVMGSTDEGASAVQWECNDSDDQKWIVDIKLKDGAVMDTSKTYTFRNVNSGLYLENGGDAAEAGLDLTQTGSADGWMLEDAGDGYYKIYSEAADGKTYLLNVSAGLTDNGTSAELWLDAGTDSQLFKFVLNDDGSYTITTKGTKDLSALGVAMGSKEEGAAIVQWECNGSDDQKWNVEEKTEEEIVIGDVNEDGKLSALDVVMLQKWLIGSPGATLTNWKNADLCADGRIDAFDLCLMKRELLNQ